MPLGKIAAILPQEEYFSPERAGALALWSNEVYPLMQSRKILMICRRSEAYLNNSIKRATISVENIQKWDSRLKFANKISFHIRSNAYPVLAAFICRSKRIDIVHIHNRPSYAYIIKKIYPKVKVVLHMHNDHMLYLDDVMLKKVFLSSDEVVAVSQYIKDGINERLKILGLPGTKIKVVLNGVNVYSFQPHVNAGSEVNILFVGRLVPEKGVMHLIKAYNAIYATVPYTTLNIVGGADFGETTETEFVKLVKNCAKDNAKITFLGPQPHSQVVELITASDIFIVPSVWDDPCPLTILEGMAAGKAIICSNRGGIPELIGNTGVILNPENINDFAGELEKLVTDKERIKYLGKKARKRAEENFSWSRVAKDFHQIFSNLN